MHIMLTQPAVLSPADGGGVRPAADVQLVAADAIFAGDIEYSAAAAAAVAAVSLVQSPAAAVIAAYPVV